MGLLVHSGWKETAIDYKFRLPLHQQNDAICIWQIPPGRHGLESSFWYGKWLIPHNWFLSTLLELVPLILSWDYQMVIWSPWPYRGFAFCRLLCLQGSLTFFRSQTLCTRSSQKKAWCVLALRPHQVHIEVEVVNIPTKIVACFATFIWCQNNLQSALKLTHISWCII